MASTNLLRILKAGVGNTLTVVMMDGWAFKGELVEFDEGSLTLAHVMETKVSEARPGFQQNWAKAAITKGLEAANKEHNVLIRIEGISRIWF